MAEIKDEIDQLIEEIAIQNQDGGQEVEGQAAPIEQKSEVIETEQQKTVTPKEILGMELESWDDVKQKLSEAENLREKLSQAESQPKVVFANEKIAGYNQFVQKYPQVENFGFYEKLSGLTGEDPIQVLVTDFVLENPQFIGKEDLVAKKIEKDFKVDANLYTPEEIEFSKLDLGVAAKKAMDKINGLRESITTSSASGVVDYGKRETSWSEGIKTGLSNFEKLQIPVFNPETKKPETYIDYEIPKEFIENYVSEASKNFSSVSDFTPESIQVVKQDAVKTFLYTNFDKICHAIKTKAASDERAKVESEYESSGFLRSQNKDASASSQSALDDYDRLLS